MNIFVKKSFMNIILRYSSQYSARAVQHCFKFRILVKNGSFRWQYRCFRDIC